MIGRRRSRIPLPPPEHTNRARVNDKIRAPQVRVIDENGQQVGILSSFEALQRAQAAGLDLVEVAPEAKPPVCRIQDFSKWLFEQQKKDRASKANAHKTDVKEIRLTPVTGQGDLDIKARHAREFLAEGHKISIQLRFRGRQMAHRELGHEMIMKFAAMLEDCAKMEQEPRQEGKSMNALLAPSKNPGLKPAASPQSATPNPVQTLG